MWMGNVPRDQPSPFVNVQLSGILKRLVVWVTENIFEGKKKRKKIKKKFPKGF